jgi:hypothetical protein
LAFVTLCVSVALLASGCGSSSISNAVDPVAKAATVSNRAAGMRMKFALVVSTPALPSPLVGNGSGSFDVAGHSGSMTIDFGGIPQLAALLGSSTMRIQEIIDGLTLYLKLPAALASGSGQHGKPWAKIDLGRAARAAGIPGLSSLMSNPTASDPSQFLRYLRASSGRVTKVGTQTVDGFQTTEYRATIDLNKVPDAQPKASRAQIRQAVAALEQAGHIHVMPMTVWIDRQNLVRRMEFSFKETVSGQSLSSKMRMDITQYGPQPPPQLPPPSQVTDVTPGVGASTGSTATTAGG